MNPSESMQPENSAPTQQLAEGTVLFSRYRILRELGRGRTGVVFLAHDEELGVEVAVKLLPDEIFRDGEALVCMKREVLRGMALTHPGIVRTYEFVRDERMAGVVMEYIDGGSFNLLRTLQPGGCFDPHELLPWLEHLCPLLDFAHFQAGVVHGDLNPGNLMFTSTGYLKVAGFGSAPPPGEPPEKGAVPNSRHGTPPYMSPQQLMGASPSHLDDIYALGAIIYDLLTGAPPFHLEQFPAGVMECVAPAMAERRRELGVTGKKPIPPAWERAVAACLAKDPSRRPQRAGEVLAGLKASSCAHPRLEVAPRVAPSRVVVPVSVPSQPNVLGWIITLVAVVAGLLVFLLWPKGHQGEPMANPDSAGGPLPVATAPHDVPPQTTVAAAAEPVAAAAEPVAAKPGDLRKSGLGGGAPTDLRQIPAGAGTRAAETGTTSGMLRAGLPLAAASAVDLAAAGPGDLRGVDLGSGLQLVFCGIGAGSFRMGSPHTEPGRKPDETQHEVTLTKAFWLARTELTRAQWAAVMGGPTSASDSNDLPAGKLTWHEAAEFCRKLTAREHAAGRLPKGWEFALPTEAQWEYACRAGTTGPVAGSGHLPEMGWHEENGSGKVHPVGRKKANAWGLHDMHGNLAEWCADWYGSYSSASVTDPTGPASGTRRVIRGGKASDRAPECGAARRSSSEPGTRIEIGLRPALVPSLRNDPPGIVAVSRTGPGAQSLPGNDDFRLWTSTAGTVIEAQLVELLPRIRSVRLRLRDGKDLTVALERLSEADREFVEDWKPADGKGSAADGTPWAVREDERSHQAHHAAIDLARVAVRIPPGDPQSLEFLISYRKGTPDRGKLSIFIDHDRDPTTGPSGESVVLFVELDTMNAGYAENNQGGWQMDSGHDVEAKRLPDQIVIRAKRWSFNDFNYRVHHSAFVERLVELPCPTDQASNAITLDGKTGDWAGTVGCWTATEPEMPISYCLADPQCVWACRRGSSLFLRVRFPANAVLWEQDGDVNIVSSGVGIAVLPTGRSFQHPTIWCTLPKEVIGDPGGKRTAPAAFAWEGSEMEIEVRNIPADLASAQIHLLFHSQKVDEIKPCGFHAKIKAAP